ncbi:hypothetical protein ACFWOT_20520 [Streptomyces sp. NPDC058440]|uniref:hypothetical protein n=1 Tax=Streptomyces sp. NPDC058440 TaxID=3346501 RepID=UPI003667D226
MKIDLVRPERRGLATGLNEAAGYTAVSITTLLTGYLATVYGLRPVPELIGVVFVAAGLALSLMVRDTAAHVALELSQHPGPCPVGRTLAWLPCSLEPPGVTVRCAARARPGWSTTSTMVFTATASVLPRSG